MKKVIFAAIAFTFFNVSEAQTKNGKKEFNPETKATKQTTRLADSISITEVQKESLKGIFTEFYTTVKEVRTKKEKSKEDFKTIKEAKTQRDEKVKTVLADEAKFAKYQSMTLYKKNHKRGYKGKKAGKTGKAYSPENASKMAEFRVKRISDSIELTQTQQDSLTAIFTERSATRATFRKAETKTEQDKEVFIKTMKIFDTRIENVLGNKEKYEQYKKLNERKHKHFNNDKKGQFHKKGKKKK